MKAATHKFFDRMFKREESVTTAKQTDELTLEQLDQVTAIPVVHPVSDDFQAFITQDAEFDQKIRKLM